MRAHRWTILVLVAVLGAGVVGVTLWAQGYRMYAVTSGSMRPTFAVGDLTITAPPQGTYRVGDIVTVPSPTGATHAVTTHRVSAIIDGLIQTRGDANPDPDIALHDPTDIGGPVAASVSGGGYLLVFLRQPTGVLALLCVLVNLTLLWELFLGAETTRTSAPRPSVLGPAFPLTG